MKRSCEEARTVAQRGDYYAGDWEPWRKLVDEYQTVLTAHAAEFGIDNRFELEQAVVKDAKAEDANVGR
ncbi:hypothetical protein [Streptomyces violascens]|uniref:hypothetical protein n=1 Tax=Streptomyces violascens TaxID=67381 RepID=UPI0036C1A476